MGLRFIKRIPLANGVRLNISKSGFSFSLGKRGRSVTFGQRGVTGNVGIPGTGISYRGNLVSGGTQRKRKRVSSKTMGTQSTQRRQVASRGVNGYSHRSPKKNFNSMKWAQAGCGTMAIFFTFAILTLVNLALWPSIVFIVLGILSFSFCGVVIRNNGDLRGILKTILNSIWNRIKKIFLFIWKIFKVSLVGTLLLGAVYAVTDKEYLIALGSFLLGIISLVLFFKIFRDKVFSWFKKGDSQPKQEVSNSLPEGEVIDVDLILPLKVADVMKLLDEKRINKLIDDIARCDASYEYDGVEPSTYLVDAQRDATYEKATLVIGSFNRRVIDACFIQRVLSLTATRSICIQEQLFIDGIIAPIEKGSKKYMLIVDKNELFVRKGSRCVVEEIRLRYRAEIEERTQYYIKLKEAYEFVRYRQQVEVEKEKLKKEILERKEQRELREQARKELQAEGIIENVRTREPIPQEVQDIVWRRDGGRCVKCGSQENLEFDHIIPFSKGGSNTPRNLQLLCQKCNREKSNHIG